jgi:parvulin-like peptidyl-prolyl isomerase
MRFCQHSTPSIVAGMKRRAWLWVVPCVALLWPGEGCRRGSGPAPPPDARRPVIKTEAELVAEREERIRTGQVVPTSAPTLAAENASTSRPTILTPIQPTPGAIEAEILLVNDSVLTLPEVLYPLRERIAEARQSHTREGFLDALQRMLRTRVQQEVGAILIHKQAMAQLSEQQHKVVTEAIDREVQNRISREFGGSSARFGQHLAENGLTLERYRAALEREMVARQYTREKLEPQISVSRTELRTYFERNRARFATQETRELWMIEAPFEAFLPPVTPWGAAPPEVRAQAKVRAARYVRAAHEALAEKPFEDVAREYSRGVHAAQGGAWGEIGRPLQPPHDQTSKVVFQLAEGQYSEPMETEAGWYIVKCGRIKPAEEPSFAAAQEQIREELSERKFEKLSAEYMIRLAEHATVSSVDGFIRAGIRRVLEAPPTGQTQR